VCVFVSVFVGVITITRNCVHRSSPNWVSSYVLYKIKHITRNPEYVSIFC